MDSYNELLEATIQHLEGLKSKGVRYVPVSPETLQALKQPVAKAPVPPAAPTAKPSFAKVNVAPAVTAPVSKPAFAPVEAVIAPVRPPTDPARMAKFVELNSRVASCIKCPNLASTRKTTVFGVGDIHARLMFVGEAPGAEEDEQGEPFVGKAGQLLNKIIQTMGLTRQKVYIANILKCRPDTPGQAAGNRKPTAPEMATCIPYLHEQIDLIQPAVLVALGGTAVEGLLGATVGITKLRGNWQTYRGIPLMPTYHPAYLLRNQSLSEKRKVWEDMLAVMTKLGMPISEKQLGYFLS